MSTIRAIQKTGAKDRRKDGSCPIYISISSGTLSLRSTKIAVLPEHWLEQEEMVSKKHPLHKEYNEIIDARKAEAVKAELELLKSGNQFKSIDIKAKVKRAKYQDFLAFAKAHNARYTEYYTGKTKNNKLNSLLEFDKEITWASINKNFVKAWVAYQREKGHADSTIHGKLKYLRQLVDEAAQDGVYKWEENPFKGTKVSGVTDPKDGLTLDELIAFRNVILPDGWLKQSQKIFVLQVLCFGMRIGDVLRLKAQDWDGKGRITYRMGKNNRPLVIDLPEAAIKIIKDMHVPGDKYLLPLIKFKPVRGQKEDHLEAKAVEALTAKINDSIKLVAFRAGIDKKITTHTARRTWAQVMRTKTGNDQIVIRDGLAHRSARTTEQYTGTEKFERISQLSKEAFGELG